MLEVLNEKKTGFYGFIGINRKRLRITFTSILKSKEHKDVYDVEGFSTVMNKNKRTYKFEQWRSDGSSVIYGENPRLDMTYESGEAKGIREEIQIHGGRQKGYQNPYLWNTGGCLRVFDDAIVTLKSKIVELEKGNEGPHYINISHSLKFDDVSQKYFIPSDYEELKLSPNNQELLKKGIINKKYYYRNEKNYYTDNINA